MYHISRYVSVPFLGMFTKIHHFQHSHLHMIHFSDCTDINLVQEIYTKTCQIKVICSHNGKLLLLPDMKTLCLTIFSADHPHSTP